MELVFDSALVEEEVGGRRVLRLKKHQVLMRLGHPIMRQAMATLCRQLHDPDRPRPDLPLVGCGPAPHGLRGPAGLPLHGHGDQRTAGAAPRRGVLPVFRVEGDRLEPVEDDFEQTVLGSEFHPIKSPARRDDWVQALRGRWFQHSGGLEAFLQDQETALRDVLQARADATTEAGTDAAKESYRYRLKELQDRSREQEIEKLAKELVRAAGRGRAV